MGPQRRRRAGHRQPAARPRRHGGVADRELRPRHEGRPAHVRRAGPGRRVRARATRRAPGRRDRRGPARRQAEGRMLPGKKHIGRPAVTGPPSSPPSGASSPTADPSPKPPASSRSDAPPPTPPSPPPDCPGARTGTAMSALAGARREISQVIERHTDPRLDKVTASAETVRRMITGKVLPGQERLYAVFRVLCDLAEVDPDAERWEGRRRVQPPRPREQLAVPPAAMGHRPGGRVRRPVPSPADPASARAQASASQGQLVGRGRERRPVEPRRRLLRRAALLAWRRRMTGAHGRPPPADPHPRPHRRPRQRLRPLVPRTHQPSSANGRRCLTSHGFSQSPDTGT